MPKSIHQKITNPNCKHLNAAQKNFYRKKLLVKYWWNWHLVGDDDLVDVLDDPGQVADEEDDDDGGQCGGVVRLRSPEIKL